ncbi:Glutathione-binding protein GsiB [subsurface metagenome]
MFLNDLARHLRMISPTAYEKNGEEWMNVHAIGTGPFMIKEFARNQLVTYEKNPDYWQEGLPYLDGLEVLQIRDPMTAIAALKKGEVLVLNEVPVSLAAELRGTGDFDVQWIPALHVVIVMNSTNPDSIWSDKRMREALEYAVDKDKISSALGEGFLEPCYEIVHSINLAGSPKTTPRKYDPEKARQLMAEAGYADGVKVKLTTNADMPQDEFVALQENLAAVGIEIELNPVSGAALNQMSFEPAPGSDLRIEMQRGGPGNPLGSSRETLSEKSVYLPGLKRPQGFEALLDQALQEPDPDKQLALLLQMEEMAYEDVMFVPLWNKPIIAVISPKVQGAYFFYGAGPGVRLEEAWLAEK